MASRVGGSRLKFGKGPTRRHQGAPAGCASAIQVREAGSVRVGVVGTKALMDPARLIGASISEALDPTKAPSKPKTFAEMTPAEREEMRRLYEKKS